MIKTPSGIVLGGAGIFKKGMTQLGGTINLNLLIKQLFANSEQGFTQTLDDYSILFQDAAGTTPVTGAGQTLGLVLDKSKGLVFGGELVTNGDFSNDTTNWTAANASFTVASGEATITNTSSSSEGYITQGITVPNTMYKVTLTVGNNSSGGAITLGGRRIGLNGAGTKVLYLLANTNSGILIGTNAVTLGNYIKVSNISVKPLSGNPAVQSTSSYRPLLQNTPRRVQYDGIDDKLTTTLPAQLTGCTVIRAIPNVGCQILTNQTIPTPYNDSTSHCGLIVINRALTAYETSLVTQIFNKLAGV